MRPNILLIVWDACRLDYARQHAPNLADLAEDNLWFENAIAPGGYSLPTHASIITGEYPHEHGIYEQNHSIERNPLLSELAEHGYTRWAVSANGFASSKFGFDQGFDRFYNTQGQMVYPDGLDVHRYFRQVQRREGEFDLSDIGIVEGLKTVFDHDHPLKSFANVSAALLQELVAEHEVLRRIPHRRFSKFSEFNYSPSKNTRLLKSLFEDAADDEGPFFVFSNYMDAHHPYAPPKRLQREFCGRTFSYRELARTADVTHPLAYLDRRAEGWEMDDETVRTVRKLYAGEVRTADEHLGRVMDALDEYGLREETLIIVTADHGENLGETDRMGERRFGHVGSISDHLFRVPLVVAHPEIEGRGVEEYVSLKDLYGLVTDPDPFIDSAGGDLGSLAPPDGCVSGQLPASSNSAVLEKYPAIADILKRHMVASYSGEWKVVVTSSEENYAWWNGETRDVEEAPDAVVERARHQLGTLIRESGGGRELSESERTHLEALGYL